MSQSVYAKNELQASKENEAWNKLFELFGERSSVLDVGCSSGHFGQALIRDKQCKVVGVDINEADLKIAAKHLSKAVKKDIERDDLGDLGSFDYILMADIIEHVIDPVKVLKKIKKLLKPGGKLVFSVPNMANIINRIELLGGRFEYTEYGLLDETHLHYYDRIELEKVLAMGGFKIHHYNNVIRDIPKPILLAQLKKLGLSAEKSFIKMAQGLDAVTFQFIGVALPVPKELSRQTAQLSSKTPYDFVSQRFDETRRLMAAEVDRFKAEVESLKNTNKELVKQKQAATRELNDIKSSKSWRMLEKFHAVRHRLSAKGRQK